MNATAECLHCRRTGLELARGLCGDCGPKHYGEKEWLGYRSAARAAQRYRDETGREARDNRHAFYTWCFEQIEAAGKRWALL